MAKQIKYKLNIDDSGSSQTLGKLEKHLESLHKEIQNTELGSKRFNELQQEISQTDARLREFDRQMEGMDAEQLAGQFGDLAMSGGDLAAGFALLTDSGEEAQQTFNEIFGALEAMEGAIRAPIAAMNIYAQRAQIAAQAQKVLNTVMRANPWGLVATAIGTAAAALGTWYALSEDATVQAKKYNREIDRGTELTEENTQKIAKEGAELQMMISKIENANKGTRERKQAISDLQEKYGPYIDNLKEEDGTLRDLNEIYGEVISKRVRDLQAKQLQKRLQDELNDQVKDEVEFKKDLNEKLDDVTLTYEDLNNAIENAGNATNKEIRQAAGLQEQYEKSRNKIQELRNEKATAAAGNRERAREIQNEIDKQYENLTAIENTTEETRKLAEGREDLQVMGDKVLEQVQALIGGHQKETETTKENTESTEENTEAKEVNLEISKELQKIFDDETRSLMERTGARDRMNDRLVKQRELQFKVEQGIISQREADRKLAEQKKENSLEIINAINRIEVEQGELTEKERKARKQAKEDYEKWREKEKEFQKESKEDWQSWEKDVGDAISEALDVDPDSARGQEIQKGFNDLLNEIGGVMDARFDAQRKKIQQNEEQQIESAERIAEREKEILKARLEQKEITEEEFDKKMKKVQRQRELREWRAEKRAFEREQQVAKREAVMNQAAAIAEVWASHASKPPVAFALSALAAGQLAVQIATIEQQQPPQRPQFERGGLIGGRRHAQGGTMIEAEEGEIILNRNVAADPGMLAAASAMNEATGGRSFVDQGAQKETLQEKEGQKEVRAYVVERDISEKQKKQRRRENRAKL